MDGLFDIFAIEQKRLADEAKARGDTRAHAVHARQAQRFNRLQQRENRRALESQYAEEDHILATEVPTYKMKWEFQREHMLDMIPYVHIHRYGTIICHGGIYTTGEFPKITAVGFMPHRKTKTIKRGYEDTRFYRQTLKPLCPQCLVEDQMIKNGVVE